ncbi:uncharacterized protein RCO7_01404 [Rhynchosporium graminicola]|uniref:DUF1765-domain-containing protein n=1 Tax=Rhynchosporium graminicola TaxID=2792576 RepID=A0A1E1K3B6_9HELO|nr:uncharacterized protein RCO7_01404 [Rhynchosporium commune]
MSTVYTTDSTFHRSHSSPTLPELVNFDFPLPATRPNDELPRSASFHSLPTLDALHKSEEEKNTAAERPALVRSQTQDVREDKTVAGNRLTKEERPKLERMGRRKSLVARPKSWIAKVKGNSPERQNASETVVTTPSDAPPVPAISKSIRDKDSKTKTVSGSFATFARKSWITHSRSPSPSSRNTSREIETEGMTTVDLKMTGSPLTSSQHVNTTSNSENAAPTPSTDSPPKARSATTFQKIKQRPASVLMNFTNFNSSNSSTSSLPRSSLDNKSTPRTSIDRVPALPTTFSTEKFHINYEPARKRDELWSAFRSLENDFSKFQSKSWSLKTNVVRASLLPFLKNHVAHPSNKNLRPEELDRRVTVLNKWWTGLLEVLDGRQNQTVSGVDRPILLEACYMVMTRPEWRLSPSHFAPLAERSTNRSPEKRQVSRRKSSSASSKSSASQFMTESVYHNTRNLFVHNLLSQMSFVVDKMSLRHAPASLVNFCGKAAAYAFFFVPGIADILVRLWKLESDVLKRVSDVLGMPRRVNKIELDDVNCAFPNHIQGLGWTSVKTTVNLLRQTPTLPILAAKIAWNGPWIARWCGRDSDLFYVFVKHYHVLVEEFMPDGLSLAQKARAPGFIIVQAQVLAALDATIHRQPAADPLPITFDDVLAGADASAAALPLPSNNSARLMAENRLIMLLRDFISERPSDYEVARRTFAEAFGKMMQASAGRTSLFDHNACFVLLDFAEEALNIYVRFHHAHDLDWDYIDWSFWLDVCKKMLESENSMSEIRLFSFLYGSWHLITHDERRKEIMCLDWLLPEQTFDKFFNHWCPMVRAYYMRLLCWRLCRDDGEASELNTKIFSTVSLRIKTNWAHYLFLKQSAEKSNSLPPSTAPCLPAPGRRLLIIRNDSHMPSASLFLGFDGTVSSSSPQGLSGLQTFPSSKRQSTSPPNNNTADPAPKLSADSTTLGPNKKRWTFVGKILPAQFSATPSTTSSPSDPLPINPEQPQTGISSPTKTLEEARLQTALSRTSSSASRHSRPPLRTDSSSTDSETSSASSTYRVFSFKFSLEWNQHFEKIVPAQGSLGRANSVLSSASGSGGGERGDGGATGSNERRIVPPRLPAPAQAWIGARVPGMSCEIASRDPGLPVSGDRVGERSERVQRAKYAGRALAEWALVVGECNNFVERRRGEGVPGLKWIEVPVLGTEGFRKFG